MSSARAAIVGIGFVIVPIAIGLLLGLAFRGRRWPQENGEWGARTASATTLVAGGVLVALAIVVGVRVRL